MTIQTGSTTQTGTANRFRMFQSMARVHLAGAAQAIPSGVPTAISFDTIDINTDGLWKPATPTRLISAVSGKYIVTAGVYWAGNPVGFRSLALVKKAETSYAQSQLDPPGSDPVLQTVSDLIQLNAGDYVEARVRQSSGGALGVENANQTFLAMVYVGE